MHVNKTAFLKELVDRKSEPAPDAKDAAEKVGARTQMSDLAQELRGVSLFLQRVTIIGRAHDLDGIGDHLPALSFALRCDERAAHHDGSARDEMLHRGVIRERIFRDDLQVPQAGAIVQFDEGKILRIAPSADPSLHQHSPDRLGAVQSVPDGSGRKHGRKFAGRSRSYKG